MQIINYTTDLLGKIDTHGFLGKATGRYLVCVATDAGRYVAQHWTRKVKDEIMSKHKVWIDFGDDAGAKRRKAQVTEKDAAQAAAQARARDELLQTIRQAIADGLAYLDTAFGRRKVVSYNHVSGNAVTHNNPSDRFDQRTFMVSADQITIGQTQDETLPPLPARPSAQEIGDAEARHPDMILLFRVGDFYEAYGKSADEVCQATGQTGFMRGEMKTTLFPHHALETYLQKLLKAGRRVAILDPV